LAAYAFSRFRFFGRRILFGLTLVAMMLPIISNIIPLYGIMSALRLINSYLVLIIIYVVAQMPFTIWMLKNFFDASTIAVIEEAASIDGCSRFQTYFRIALPLAKPGITAAGIYCMVFYWNEFILGLIFISTAEMRTITGGLYMFQTFWGIQYGPMAAGAMVVLLPPTIAFVLMQRFFLQGMIQGSIKG